MFFFKRTWGDTCSVSWRDYLQVWNEDPRSLEAQTDSKGDRSAVRAMKSWLPGPLGSSVVCLADSVSWLYSRSAVATPTTKLTNNIWELTLEIDSEEFETQRLTTQDCRPLCGPRGRCHKRPAQKRFCSIQPSQNCPVVCAPFLSIEVWQQWWHWQWYYMAQTRWETNIESYDQRPKRSVGQDLYSFVFTYYSTRSEGRYPAYSVKAWFHLLAMRTGLRAFKLWPGASASGSPKDKISSVEVWTVSVRFGNS